MHGWGVGSGFRAYCFRFREFVFLLGFKVRCYLVYILSWELDLDAAIYAWGYGCGLCRLVEGSWSLPGRFYWLKGSGF